MSRVLDHLRTLALAAEPGDRLPSVRELAARHRASPVTVQRAFAVLSAEGLVVPRPGRGTFVAPRAAPAAEAAADFDWQTVALGSRAVDPGGLEDLLAVPRSDALTLSTGFVDQSLQPLAALAQAAGRASRRAGTWERRPVEGDEELRAWFARDVGGGFAAADVVVTSGGQSALASTFRALGHPGEAVLVESPTYLGALAAARAAGLGPVPVPVDEHGVRVELLAEAFTRTRARLAYLQPRYANPTGALLAPDRRAGVLEAASAAGAFVIEDDYARDLALDGPLAPPLAATDPHGHVVHLRSLTKAAAPGLRVGMVAARGAAGHRLRNARVVDDFFVSGLLQQTALELVSAPAWKRHRRRVAAELTLRRDALLAAVATELPAWRVFVAPHGGLHMWIRLPEGVDDIELTRQAAKAGVVISPGSPWFAAEAPEPHIRLTYAGAPAGVLRQGIHRLAQI